MNLLTLLRCLINKFECFKVLNKRSTSIYITFRMHITTEWMELKLKRNQIERMVKSKRIKHET